MPRVIEPRRLRKADFPNNLRPQLQCVPGWFGLLKGQWRPDLIFFHYLTGCSRLLSSGAAYVKERQSISYDYSMVLIYRTIRRFDAIMSTQEIIEQALEGYSGGLF